MFFIKFGILLLTSNHGAEHGQWGLPSVLLPKQNNKNPNNKNNNKKCQVSPWIIYSCSKNTSFSHLYIFFPNIYLLYFFPIKKDILRFPKPPTTETPRQQPRRGGLFRCAVAWQLGRLPSGHQLRRYRWSVGFVFFFFLRQQTAEYWWLRCCWDMLRCFEVFCLLRIWCE